jgi:hypothetical protein
MNYFRHLKNKRIQLDNMTINIFLKKKTTILIQSLKKLSIFKKMF